MDEDEGKEDKGDLLEVGCTEDKDSGGGGGMTTTVAAERRRRRRSAGSCPRGALRMAVATPSSRPSAMVKLAEGGGREPLSRGRTRVTRKQG